MKYKLILILFLSVLDVSAQDVFSLNTYTFEKAEELQEQEARPYFVFIHTDWCRYCHGMKKNTFNDPEVIKILNKNYYFITLNAEEKKDISFTGHNFRYKPSGSRTGVHELAEALGSIDGKLLYPTLVTMNIQNEISFQYSAFMDRKELIEILKNDLK